METKNAPAFGNPDAGLRRVRMLQLDFSSTTMMAYRPRPSTPLAASLSGPGYSQRPFARPQRLLPFDGLHSGVKVSDLILRTLPDRLPCPFGFSAPPPYPGLLRLRRLQRLRPVALLSFGLAG